MRPKVVFFPIQTNAAKLVTITQVAHDHFERKEPLVFLVPDEKAREYLDRLLWSTPAESFLPHPSQLIQIQLEVDVPVPTLFNLSPFPILHEGIKTIYELEDHSCPEKYKLSQKRYQVYKNRSLQIIIDTIVKS